MHIRQVRVKVQNINSNLECISSSNEKRGTVMNNTRLWWFYKKMVKQNRIISLEMKQTVFISYDFFIFETLIRHNAIRCLSVCNSDLVISIL